MMFNLELDVEVLLKKRKKSPIISCNFMLDANVMGIGIGSNRHPIGLRNIWCAKLPLSRSHFCVGAQNVNKIVLKCDNHFYHKLQFCITFGCFNRINHHKHQMQSHSYHTGIDCNDSRFLLLIYSYKNKIMKTKSRNPLKSYLINQQQKISTTFFSFFVFQIN